MIHRIRRLTILAALLAAPAAAAPPIDLSGLWQARYTVPGEPGKFTTELVSIQTYRDIVIAVKLTGNGFVPSGQITFKAIETGPEFPGQVQVAGMNFSNPHFVPTIIQVLDAGHLRVGSQLFTRLAKPAAPPTLTPAQQAQIDRQEKLEGQLLFGAFMAYLQTPSDSDSASDSDAQAQSPPDDSWSEGFDRIQQQMDEDEEQSAEAEAQSPMNNP